MRRFGSLRFLPCIAQRRPARPSRQLWRGGQVLGRGPHRSTKAGSAEPATRLRNQPADCPPRPRSTKAGSAEPATLGCRRRTRGIGRCSLNEGRLGRAGNSRSAVTDAECSSPVVVAQRRPARPSRQLLPAAPAGDLPGSAADGRSTKAGSAEPATHPSAPAARRAPSSLNEGRLGRAGNSDPATPSPRLPLWRSTKAGSAEPATRQHDFMHAVDFVRRSTKAGSAEPATRIAAHGTASAKVVMPQDRSTKAGSAEPATPRVGSEATVQTVERARSLNEGRLGRAGNSRHDPPGVGQNVNSARSTKAGSAEPATPAPAASWRQRRSVRDPRRSTKAGSAEPATLRSGRGSI